MGHLIAFLTILIWGTTFISTKILLENFSPVEILLIRFVLGFLVLLVIYPHWLPFKEKKQEILFILAGLCGICLYYLLENIALIYTQASNVGVIISAAPFFTAIAARFIIGDEKLTWNFFVGFVLAMIGICCISFSGQANLQLNPLGDLLALSASVIWALYSIFVRLLNYYDCNMIQATQRIFAYGIVFMLPIAFYDGFDISIFLCLEPVNLFNLLYLGIGASALCFVMWNWAVKMLGAVKSSVYIYLVPVITVATAYIVLDERLAPIAFFGMFLTLAGLIVSQYKEMRK